MCTSQSIAEEDQYLYRSCGLRTPPPGRQFASHNLSRETVLQMWLMITGSRSISQKPRANYHWGIIELSRMILTAHPEPVTPILDPGSWGNTFLHWEDHDGVRDSWLQVGTDSIEYPEHFRHPFRDRVNVTACGFREGGMCSPPPAGHLQPISI